MSATIENQITQALLERLQRRWAALLRRANAREAAVRGALAHARTTEAARGNEIVTLRERLRGLEQILLDHAVTRRAGTGRGDTGALGRSAPAPASLPLLPAPASASLPLLPAPVRFDPVATVAALLPLEASDVEEVSVEDALSRLRSAVRPKPDPLPVLAIHDVAASLDVAASIEEPASIGAGAPSPWLPRAFRRLAEEDPRAAGRLLLQLLPAQGLVWPEDVAYTLNVAETGLVAVEVSGDTTTVQPLLSLDLTQAPALRTDLAGLARTVTARRGWGRIGARVAGTHGTLRPLRALARAPLSLRDLERQGVELDPALLARLQALDAAAPADVAIAT